MIYTRCAYATYSRYVRTAVSGLGSRSMENRIHYEDSRWPPRGRTIQPHFLTLITAEGGALVDRVGSVPCSNHNCILAAEYAYCLWADGTSSIIIGEPRGTWHAVGGTSS